MNSGDGRAGTAAPLPAILIDGVTKTFGTPGSGDGTTLALDNVSFSVPDRTFVALLGPSGCGKTTLLRLVDGLIQPDFGRIEVFGRKPQPGPGIGFVFQSFRLIPWATVQGNVEFALRSLNLSAAERAGRARLAIETVGLAQFAGSYPASLSGGMRQRVALARAFACAPRTLLMDEPFASLDAQTRELMQIELMRLWSQSQSVVLFVTHSVDEAILLSDRIILLAPRPGRVVETLDVDLQRPRWTYDARSDPGFVALRSYLSARMRDLVLSDPTSEFFGRDVTASPVSDA